MEKKIKLFLEFLQKDKKLSNNTLQSYKRDITQYESYINEENLQYLKVTKDDIKKYIASLVTVLKNQNIGEDIFSSYSKNIENVETTGDFKMKGIIKGKVTDETIPTLDISIKSSCNNPVLVIISSAPW